MYVKTQILKVGYSVSKKNGKAVVRNKIKRQLRACVRPFLNSLGDYYIVIVPKSGQEYDFHNFEKDISFLLNKENLLKWLTAFLFF